MNICFHCHEEIEKSSDAACGWRHTSGRVICRPTDATPMSPVQQQWWEYEHKQSPFYKTFVLKEKQ